PARLSGRRQQPGRDRVRATGRRGTGRTRTRRRAVRAGYRQRGLRLLPRKEAGLLPAPRQRRGLSDAAQREVRLRRREPDGRSGVLDAAGRALPGAGLRTATPGFWPASEPVRLRLLVPVRDAFAVPVQRQVLALPRLAQRARPEDA